MTTTTDYYFIFNVIIFRLDHYLCFKVFNRDLCDGLTFTNHVICSKNV